MSPALTSSLPSASTLNAVELRQQLGEVLERVHYRFAQFRIMRKDKPMARLVNETYMQTIERLLAEEPAMSETLEIMLDQEFMNALQQGDKEIDEGKLLPIEAALEA